MIIGNYKFNFKNVVSYFFLNVYFIFKMLHTYKTIIFIRIVVLLIYKD